MKTKQMNGYTMLSTSYKKNTTFRGVDKEWIIDDGAVNRIVLQYNRRTQLKKQLVIELNILFNK